jgi:PIN domain nuclease of toxin-antitoxin system
VRLLLDTHLLLWTTSQSHRLSHAARTLFDDRGNELFFSAASFWEIGIKLELGRANFRVDPVLLRRSLLNRGYGELTVTSEHGLAVKDLPLLHRDPFDRILIAQSIVEGITLVTSDPIVARYPGPVQRV